MDWWFPLIIEVRSDSTLIEGSFEGGTWLRTPEQPTLPCPQPELLVAPSGSLFKKWRKPKETRPERGTNDPTPDEGTLARSPTRRGGRRLGLWPLQISAQGKSAPPWCLKLENRFFFLVSSSPKLGNPFEGNPSMGVSQNRGTPFGWSAVGKQRDAYLRHTPWMDSFSFELQRTVGVRFSLSILV